MPKSGHMANQHAKVARGGDPRAVRGPAAEPRAGDQQHVLQLHHRQGRRPRRSVHQYDADKKTFVAVPGCGRPVAGDRASSKASYAFAWAKNIWADMLDAERYARQTRFVGKARKETAPVGAVFASRSARAQATGFGLSFGASSNTSCTLLVVVDVDRDLAAAGELAEQQLVGERACGSCPG